VAAFGLVRMDGSLDDASVQALDSYCLSGDPWACTVLEERAAPVGGAPPNP